MTTSTRTDIHRPVDMDPADYEYTWAFDNLQPGVLVNVDMDWWRSITNWPEATRERGTHQCHHCGAAIRYVAILKHVPTGDHIAVGETCLDNRFELESKADFDRLRKAAQLDRQKQRLLKAYNAYLADPAHADLVAAFGADDKHSIVADIQNKLRKYGSISDPQANLVRKLERERIERKTRIAVEKTEPKFAAPEGRVTIEGEVVNLKWVEGFREGEQTQKMLVKVTTPAGSYKVWSTVPFSCCNIQRGDTVKFAATLTQSDDDESFAFAKRPTQATYQEHCNCTDRQSALDPCGHGDTSEGCPVHDPNYERES